MPEPTIANGKICYLEIPTDDIPRSATFYGEVFGWSVRRRPNGVKSADT